MGKVVEIDCEKSMKLETSRNEVCIGVAVSVKNICARFITVSVKKLLHYRAGGLLQYRAFYYIIGQLLHYRAFFITLSGSYYSIGRLLHYRLVQHAHAASMHISMHRLCSVVTHYIQHVSAIFFTNQSSLLTVLEEK